MPRVTGAKQSVAVAAILATGVVRLPPGVRAARRRCRPHPVSIRPGASAPFREVAMPGGAATGRLDVVAASPAMGYTMRLDLCGAARG